MKDVILGLVGVGRIGVMHANNIAALNGEFNAQGINVELRLTDVAEEHARAVAAGLGAEFLPSVEALIAASPPSHSAFRTVVSSRCDWTSLAAKASGDSLPKNNAVSGASAVSSSRSLVSQKASLAAAWS